MAWTWPTAAFFVAIVSSIIVMGVWEKYSPGGNPRRGVFGIDTTRGDRLFISWLGTGFIHLGWLGFFSTPLWGALALACGWFVFVFRKV
jgi:predicted small integral membrane protein